MRRILFLLFTQDPALIAIMGTRWVGSTGLDGESDQALGLDRPFGTFRITGDFLGMGTSRTIGLEVWAHQEPGSYDIVDAILARVKVLLESTTQVHNDEKTTWLQEAKWGNNSPDLYDDIRRTNTRMASFTLVGSGI